MITGHKGTTKLLHMLHFGANNLHELEPSQASAIELVNYFYEKAPSQIFGWVLNTPRQIKMKL